MKRNIKTRSKCILVEGGEFGKKWVDYSLEELVCRLKTVKFVHKCEIIEKGSLTILNLHIYYPMHGDQNNNEPPFRKKIQELIIHEFGQTRKKSEKSFLKFIKSLVINFKKLYN